MWLVGFVTRRVLRPSSCSSLTPGPVTIPVQWKCPSTPLTCLSHVPGFRTSRDDQFPYLAGFRTSGDDQFPYLAGFVRVETINFLIWQDSYEWRRSISLFGRISYEWRRSR